MKPNRPRWYKRLSGKDVGFLQVLAGVAGVLLALYFGCRPQPATGPTKPDGKGIQPNSTALDTKFTVAAELPPKALLPAIFTIINGDYELRAVDPICALGFVESDKGEIVTDLGQQFKGMHVAIVPPKGQFSIECFAPTLFRFEGRLRRAVIAVDIEFAVTGQVGRYFATFIFVLTWDRADRPIWTLTSQKGGPTATRKK